MVKTIKQRVVEGWAIAAKQMSDSEGFRRILNGDITSEHYKAIMEQVWWQVRETPQLQGLAASIMFNSHARILGTFLRHAVTEVGHDDWVLEDLKVMGVDINALKRGRPLPATTALIGFPYHQLHHRNLWGYMGYIFHFEHTATASGESYKHQLLALGVPEEAMTFLNGHIEIDVMHNEMMDSYLDNGVKGDEDVENLIFGAQTTAWLYGQMMTEAIRLGDARLAGAGELVAA